MARALAHVEQPRRRQQRQHFGIVAKAHRNHRHALQLAARRAADHADHLRHRPVKAADQRDPPQKIIEPALKLPAPPRLHGKADAPDDQRSNAQPRPERQKRAFGHEHAALRQHAADHRPRPQRRSDITRHPLQQQHCEKHRRQEHHAGNERASNPAEHYKAGLRRLRPSAPDPNREARCITSDAPARHRPFAPSSSPRRDPACARHR